MSGRLCDKNVTESQEHLKTCQGTLNKQRGQITNTFEGKVIFWRIMAIKLETGSHR